MWAISNDYKIIETDIDFTKDGVPVCLHDSTIDRTSNGTGECSSYTLDELREFDFGDYFYGGADYEKEEIVTLEEFLVLCKESDTTPYLDLALQGFTSEQMQTIYDTACDMNMQNQAIFDVDVNEAESLVCLDNNLNITIDPINASDDVAVAASYKNRSNVLYCAIPLESYSQKLVEACHGSGLKVLTWSLNDPEQIRLFHSNGCDLVFTDTVTPKMLSE